MFQYEKGESYCVSLLKGEKRDVNHRLTVSIVQDDY